MGKREATAEYLHAQLNGMTLMARKSGMDILAYLIEMAALEAANEIAKGGARK
jgi:hypothetical protein